MKTNHYNHIKLVIILIFIFYSTVGLSFVTVGSTVDCDYNNLLDAYNDADVFVRVTSQQVHADSFTIIKTKWFTGGYDTCADAESGTLGLFKTKWSGQDNRTVIRFEASTAVNSILTLDNFEIYDGSNIFFAGAGGIKVSGKSTLILANSELHDNSGNEGGGIRVAGADAKVTITNSRIYDNTSTTAGAGVYCENSAQFTMLGDSTIKNNIAQGDGGGIFGNIGCQINVTSGDDNPILDVDLGIVSNQASKGGGVYLKNDADMTLTGNDEHPATIIGNISKIDTNSLIIGGGGVYITGSGTTFEASNARIDFNLAQYSGAGIAVLNSASFTMRRLDTPCWNNEKCSSIANNFVVNAFGDAGAGFIYDQATADISGTYIAYNHADESAAFAVDNVGYLRLEGNLIIGNTSFSQVYAAKLISATGNNGLASNVDFFYNTVASNNVFSIFYLDGTSSQQFVRVNNSIIWDQGNVIETTGAINPSLDVHCNFVHETISILAEATSQSDNYNVNPQFIDAANDDYHVSRQSNSKDLCNEATIQSLYKDLNGNVRGIDDPTIVDLRGPFDAGAYEQPLSIDLIFSNGFEL